MIIEILAADTVAMSVRIVSPAEDARVWDIGREEVSEPVHVVRRRPGLVAVAVEAMDGNDAGNWSGRSLDRMKGLLYNWLLSLCHDLEALGRRLKRLLRFRRAASLLQCQPEIEVEWKMQYIMFRFIPKRDQSS